MTRATTVVAVSTALSILLVSGCGAPHDEVDRRLQRLDLGRVGQTTPCAYSSQGGGLNHNTGSSQTCTLVVWGERAERELNALLPTLGFTTSPPYDGGGVLWTQGPENTLTAVRVETLRDARTGTASAAVPGHADESNRPGALVTVTATWTS